MVIGKLLVVKEKFLILIICDMLGYGDMGRGSTKEQKLNINAQKTLSDVNVSTEQVPDHVMKAFNS